MPDQDGDGIPDGFDTFFGSGDGSSSGGGDGSNGGGNNGDGNNGGEAPPTNQDPWNGQSHYNYNGTEYGGTWSDQDGDGIPDGQDATPNGGYWYNGTEYSGSWTDSDADGIPDGFDNYPGDTWNGAPHFMYQGIIYPGSISDDRDSDGIPDLADAYPDDSTNRADSDNDGLSDYDENTQYGTDPAKVDTDDDRLSDSDELFTYHTNPLLAKTNPDQPYSDFYMVNQADDDADGIPNGIEQWYADQGLGMNPADPADARGDLDGDGYSNLQAWQNGWSLTSHTGTYDYDQDGILDVLEDAWNAAYPGIFDNHNFNDSVEDFDGDGLMNFEEIALGLNPGKANSRHTSVYDVQEWAWRGLVVGGPAGLSFAGAALTSSVQPEWQVMEDANHDSVPDGLLAFVTALNADATLVTLPQRVASGDYDGDGMLDFWEHRYNLDLRAAADAQANPDGDTLINSLEYAHGRNPLVSDDPPPELPPLDDPNATPHIVTTSLPDGAVNAGYNGGIVVSGGTGPYQISLSSGSLPDGLFLDTNGGITGTPTTEMSSSFTVQVVDGRGLIATQAFTLNVMPDAAGGGGTGGSGGDGGSGTTGGDGAGGGNGDGTGTGGNGDGNNGNDSPQPATGGAEIVARSANAQLLEVRGPYNTAAPKLKQIPFDTNASSSTQDGATSEFIAAQAGDDIVSITVSEAPHQPTELPWEYYVPAFDPDTGSSMGMERRTFTGTLAGAQAAKTAADPDDSGSGPDPVGGFIPWKWRVAGIRNVLDSGEPTQGGLLLGYQYGQKLWGADNYQILQTQAQLDLLEADAPLSWVDAATSSPSNSPNDEAWMGLLTAAPQASGGWMKYKGHYIPQGGATEVRLRRTDLSEAAMQQPITRSFLRVRQLGNSSPIVRPLTLTIAAGDKISKNTGPDVENGAVLLSGRPAAEDKTATVTEQLLEVKVNVYNTEATNDDIVRKEQKIGDKAWRQWIPCTVIIPNVSASQTTSIAVSSEGNTMKFAQDTQEKPNNSTAGEASVTVALDAQGEDKKMGKFWITGITQSANIGDAKLQIKKNSTNGEMIATKPMTVFWFDQPEITFEGANPNGATWLRDRESLPDALKSPMLIMVGKTKLKPNGLNTSAPQISEWPLGLVQNVMTHWHGSRAAPPTVPASQWQNGDPRKFRKVMKRTWAKLTSPVWDAVGKNGGTEPKGKGPFADSYKTTGRFSQTGSASYIFDDSPQFPFPDREPCFNYDTSQNNFPPLNVKWPWLTHESNTTFDIWLGVGNDNHNEFVPVLQATWRFNATFDKDQGVQGGTSTSAARQPDSVPKTTSPLSVSEIQNQVDTGNHLYFEDGQGERIPPEIQY